MGFGLWASLAGDGLGYSGTLMRVAERFGLRPGKPSFGDVRSLLQLGVVAGDWKRLGRMTPWSAGSAKAVRKPVLDAAPKSGKSPFALL